MINQWISDLGIPYSYTKPDRFKSRCGTTYRLSLGALQRGCQAELQRRDDDGIGEAAQSEENSHTEWVDGIGWD